MDRAPPTGTETILLVDDQEPVRKTTARILERLGYRVLQAGEAEQALRMAGLSNIHLLLMDVVLPGMSGLELAGKIASMRPSARILYTSAYTSEEVLDERLEDHPGVDFLQKPYGPAELGQAVRDLLDRAVPSAPAPEPIPEGDESILVVEDDDQTRRLMVRMLEPLGYRVLEAHYPDRARTIVANSRVDLVVVDVVLPETDGMSLARAMAQEKPSLRFLFISGKAPEALARERAPGPSFHFLQKPFTPLELGQAVRGALDDRSSQT